MKRKTIDPQAERAREEQIQRLRELLALMALETGSSALGAGREFSRVRDTSPQLPVPQPRDGTAAA